VLKHRPTAAGKTEYWVAPKIDLLAVLALKAGLKGLLIDAPA
jgi:hypothetical protein